MKKVQQKVTLVSADLHARMENAQQHGRRLGIFSNWSAVLREAIEKECERIEAKVFAQEKIVDRIASGQATAADIAWVRERVGLNGTATK